MKNVVSCTFNDTTNCERIFRIRQSVFVDEQKVSREEEFDEYEKSAVHYLGLINDTPAGTARWRITEKGIKLERFAVLPEFRNKGIAAAILKKVLDDVQPIKLKIYLHAQETAVGFYEKYGFKKEGAMFMEANIRHFTMYVDEENVI